MPEDEPTGRYRTGDGPLTGMRVVEVATYVAGPLGGMTLAQLGADVIRVDPIGGAADTRRLPVNAAGASLYWAGLNKQKRSVEIDLSSPRGRELVAGLVAAPGRDAGVLLTNAPMRGALSHGRLAERRSDVITVRIVGDASGVPAVDYTVNARTGVPLATGPRGSPVPVNHVLPAWDIACGCLAAAALLGADRYRTRTGKGEEVEVALADVALAITGHLGFLTEAQLLGRERAADGNHLYGAFGTDFPLRDGHRVMVVALTPRHWDALVAATGTREAVDAVARTYALDLREPSDLYAARDALAGVLSPWFAGRDLDEVAATLSDHGVLWERYRSFGEVAGEVATDPGPLFASIDQPGIGTHPAPHAPVDFRGAGQPSPGPAPTLGADTDAVLASVLGLASHELGKLRADGVIARPAGTR